MDESAVVSLFESPLFVLQTKFQEEQLTGTTENREDDKRSRVLDSDHRNSSPVRRSSSKDWERWQHSRWRSLSGDRERHSRRRSRSQDRDRGRERRGRSRSMSDSDREKRHQRRSRSSSSRERRRSANNGRNGGENQEGRKVERQEIERLDYSRLIEGYENMSPAERIKATMKHQLAETAKLDDMKGTGQGWERFEFNKDAPLDDEEIKAAEDDATLVKHIGQNFRFSAIEARKAEHIRDAHNEAMFGVPIGRLLSTTDHEAEEVNTIRAEESCERALSTNLLSEKKLTALKKAYADIILNTAKEAAARIMVSERKAIRFQQELSATKDESFRMLLRLKRMLDSKVCEAEIVSLNQKKKIEELEAQLEEAEDIVRDLRTELQEVQDELENLKIKNIEPLDKQNLAITVATQENTSNLHDQVAANTSSTLNGAYLGNWRESKSGDKDGVHNQDFPAIVMRSKEPELYKNGCTQRVRAFERNLFDEKACLTGQTEDVKNIMFNMSEQKDKLKCKTNTPKDDSMCGEKKNTNELKALSWPVSKEIQVPIVKSLRRKRKRATRFNRIKAHTILDGITEQCKSPDLLCSESLLVVTNDLRNCTSKMNDIDDQNGLVVSSTPVLSEIKEMLTPSGCPNVSESGAATLNNCSFREMVEYDKTALEKSGFNGQESIPAEKLEDSDDKIGVEAVKESTISMDMKNSDPLVEAPNQHLNNKVLKYTFQRKRKKESLNSPDGKSSVDEGFLRKRMKDKQGLSLESDKFSLSTESSRDSRRLAQVARQLISLSEKSWR